MEQDTFFQTASFEDVLDDLSCRFIVNIPAEELVSLARICFQVEQAHWFYEDFVRERNPHRLPSLSLRKFSKCIFDHCPMLRQYSGTHEEEFEDFLRYKNRVPVLGGIMLDERWEKCILVKAWKGGSWSFPRGKINKDEPDIDCAIREVLEETGYDISPLIIPDAFIELQIKEQRVKLYIIPGVPTDTPMAPQTRKEISSIGWIRLVDLPGYSKHTKGTQLNIKLYMVTPFLAGLRKWINQNRHLKRMLATVEEDAGEDSMQEDVVQNGSTSDLIAMLRRRQLAEAQQPYLMQQQQSMGQGGVDLLGMLRNGAPAPQQPMVNAWYPEQYQQMFVPTEQYLAPEAPQSVDLLQFSPLVQPVSNDPQESITPPEEPATTITQPSLPADQRRNSLLSILKGPPPAIPHDTKPSSGPKVGDILHLGESRSSSTSQTQTAVEPPASEHQESLLSLLKSPKMSASVPETTTIQPASHQNSLLAALKSPPVPRAEPPQPLKEPPMPARPTQPPPPSSHQKSLLAALTSPPIPRAEPPQSQKEPHMPTPPPPASSSHKNSLLAALKQSKVQQEAPVAKQPETSATHQNTLLSALKGSKKETKAPPQPINVSSHHQMSLLNALKSPTSTSSPRFTANRAPSPKPAVEPPQPTAPVKPAPRLPSPITHQASLLSALKSPTLPPKSMQLLEALKHSPVQNDHASSLMAKLKGPKEDISTEKMEDVKTGEGKNVHMEALMKNLVSPSASPVVHPVQPFAPIPTIEPVATPVTEDTVVAAPVQQLKPAASKPVTNHVNSLLSTLKGGQPTTPPAASPSPTKNSFLAVLKGSKPATPDQTRPSKPSPPPPRTSPPTVNAQSLLRTLKSPKLNGTNPTPAPQPTSQQQSLLSLFKSASPPPPQPQPSPKPTQTQQFNFSPQRQVGKRMKFRDTLVPDGVKQVSVDNTPAKSIDLTKVTLLKRPAAENSPPQPASAATSGEDTRRTEGPAWRKASLESGPGSPLGIEFPFRKRTPKGSKGPSPATTPANTNAQSLLAILKAPIVKTEGAEVQTPVVPKDGGEENGVETMGTKREMKLIAMLERALTRGVSP